LYLNRFDSRFELILTPDLIRDLLRMQTAASQVPSVSVSLNENCNVDCCWSDLAPGGKSSRLDDTHRGRGHLPRCCVPERFPPGRSRWNKLNASQHLTSANQALPCSCLLDNTVREYAWSKAKKRKKSRFGFKKNVKKRNSNNMYCGPKVLDLNITVNQICCPLRKY